MKYVFDYHDGDIYWCTADVGWVTGHSYIVYGPLANGATTLMFEGVPNYPDVGRFWQVCDKHKVNIFYTAPTAIRALMRAGDDLSTCDLTHRCAARLRGRADQPGSLGLVLRRRRRGQMPDRRHLVADRNRRHHDHAAAGRHRPQTGLGDQAVLRRQPRWSTNDGNELTEVQTRQSVHHRQLARPDAHGLRRPRALRADLFLDYKGKYFTGDGCRRDEDGYYWITGRVDDVINVSGHRMGTAEVESALVRTTRLPKRPWSATRTTSRGRAFIATSP